jgi:hypothetical protein
MEKSEGVLELFTDRDQHDSQEFMRMLIDSLNDELNRVTQPPPYKVWPAVSCVLPHMLAASFTTFCCHPVGSMDDAYTVCAEPRLPTLIG